VNEYEHLLEENLRLKEELDRVTKKNAKLINFPKYNRLPVFSFNQEGHLHFENDAKQRLLPHIRRLDQIIGSMNGDAVAQFIDEGGVIVAMVTHLERHYKIIVRGIKALDKALCYGFDDTEAVALNQRLVSKANQANQANLAKDEFLASMSHELRTPLATIIGNCEMLSERMVDGGDRETVHAIERAGRNQLALVNDILDMSKIESGKFTIDEAPFDLSLLLSDLEKMFQVKARDQGVQFSVEQRSAEPYQLLGDGQRIAQILINLIGNAIKFTENGRVTLTAWHVANQLFFKVKDSGIGMSKEVLDKLFSRFEQADTSISRRFGGSGLGLYIAINLAEMMGGDIDASSIKGEGSVFLFYLPYRHSGIPVLPGQPGVANDSILKQQFSGNVLIAEDTPELQLLERKILESMGVTVTTVENGKEAVAQATTNHFDLILMDMQMPEMDGIEATRMLRQLGVDIPIVPLTANVMQKHRDAFVAEGADDFLAKPIDRQELRRVLRRYLMLEQNQRKLDELGIQDRREKERRFEEIATIDEERAVKTPHRLQDKIEQAAVESLQVEEEVDDELIAIFMESASKNRDKLVASLSTKAWSEVRVTAHTIKGSAASFGYPELSKMAGLVQLAIDEERLGEVPALTMDLVIEIGTVVA
jgi:signal transduction histidine kinase/DNA-binding response OmpR family regulator